MVEQMIQQKLSRIVGGREVAVCAKKAHTKPGQTGLNRWIHWFLQGRQNICKSHKRSKRKEGSSSRPHLWQSQWNKQRKDKSFGRSPRLGVALDPLQGPDWFLEEGAWNVHHVPHVLPDWELHLERSVRFFHQIFQSTRLGWSDLESAWRNQTKSRESPRGPKC